MKPVELAADAGSGIGPGGFPREWGQPPYDPDEARGWIKGHIIAGEIAERYGERPAWLARSASRRPRGRRDDPALQLENTLRLIALRRLWLPI